MTPEQQQIFALMETAEKQQKDLEQTIEKMNKILGNVPEFIVRQTHESVSQSVQSGLNTGMQQLNKSAHQLNQIAQRLSQSNDRFSWKFIGIGLGIFFALVLSFLVFLMWFVPSLDEIQQRRADVKALKPYALQVRETSDGKTLVRIMSKKPCHTYQPTDVEDKTFDWCEIDPKKY